ncbi:MAG TPA: ABC transporter ATP-binding protein [Candidatus Aquilonibacter sp.]|nr:ABC transporter ATP-binding protein [Candidatus Aquilonibacter sp.]
MAEVIRTVSLVKRFRNTLVIDHLDLHIPEESVYGLIGPNGAGKSTTIKILVNALLPTSGHAELFGRDSRTLMPEHFTQIGYVSENQQLPGWMTVDDFMDYLRPFYPNWDDRRAHELLRHFELPPDRRIRELSHGMRMKAALASSLAYRPRLIILDEPFTGLDPLVRDELIEGTLQAAAEATILVSCHDLSDIETFVSHIGYLDRGRLQFSEEMASLASRFREVEVTPATSFPPPRLWPAAWLNAEHNGAVLRFVDSDFDQQRTSAAVERLFGNEVHVSAKCMPLRSIFLTLAKAGRKAA